jgi:dTMP kinase
VSFPGIDDLPGRLFIVEGIDGSGKSTQVELLEKWLESLGYLVVFTTWNSAPIVKQTTARGKKRRLLTPMSFSLIHAADFASRVQSVILPALRAGAVVLADRYVYTAFARDGVRGVDPGWLRSLYSFAPPPTLAFYFDTPLDVAIDRIIGGRPELKFYEAGLDMGWDDDPERSFEIYQGKIREEYERLTEEFGLVRMDSTLPLIRQQEHMRRLVEPHLDGVAAMAPSGVGDALATHKLHGRYLHATREVQA